MDFHDDHPAFDPTSAGEVSHMYLPGGDDHGFGDDASPGTDDQGTGSPGTHPGPPGTTLSVSVGGHQETVAATVDIDHDGHNDTAVLDDAAGDRIAVTDTDGDGRADHAALLDESGRVVGTAHLDPSGAWVEDSSGDRNPYGGTGSTVGTDGPATGDTATGDTAGGGSIGGGAGSRAGTAPSHGITVHAGGHEVQAQATLDTDHDGSADTAVVRSPDGTTIAFSDTDGDGDADRAAVYDPDGRLVGTASYQKNSGTWVQDQG